MADGEDRGAGQPVLVLKPMPTRVTADWMAQQWRESEARSTRQCFSHGLTMYSNGPITSVATSTRRTWAMKSKHDYRTTSSRRLVVQRIRADETRRVML